MKDELKELREEIAKLRERVAVLERYSNPMTIPLGPVYPPTAPYPGAAGDPFLPPWVVTCKSPTQ